MNIKTKINKGDPIKLKNFCTAKETTNKTKRQPEESEKIFANDETNKGLVSKIYKQFMWTNIFITKNQPNQKMGRRPKETFHTHTHTQRHTNGQKAHEKMTNITNY